MDLRTRASRLRARPSGAPPALIAHTGGNSLAQAQRAIADGADVVEIDLFLHRGGFEARHARSLYPLPVWVDGVRPGRPARRRFGLADLLATAAGRAEVLLDLKSRSSRIPPLVRAAIDDAPDRNEVAASSQIWNALRRLAIPCPDVDMYYSIDVRAQLDLFLSVMDRDQLPAGVSCRHSHLTPALIRRLKERELVVVAWTVDDTERARELASWGVDAITTHKVVELREALS